MENTDSKVRADVMFNPPTYDGTFESAKKCHVYLWDYVYRMGGGKPYIPGIQCSCYACQYVEDLINKEVKYKDLYASVKVAITFRSCDFCPINWSCRGLFNNPCMDESSIYRAWCDSESREDFRNEFARRVRDLEFEDTRELLLQRIKELTEQKDKELGVSTL